MVILMAKQRFGDKRQGRAKRGNVVLNYELFVIVVIVCIAPCVHVHSGCEGVVVAPCGNHRTGS